MSQNYLFTSDTHFGDDRIGINGKPDLFYRGNSFSSVEEMDKILMDNIAKQLKPDDIFIHNGDVALYDESKLDYLQKLFSKLKCQKKILVRGNYDYNKEDGTPKLWLNSLFDEVHDNDMVLNIPELGGDVYFNHYPTKCVEIAKSGKLTITGHIHGVWKYQPSVINVGIDAWCYRPVTLKELIMLDTAGRKFYDQDCFPFLETYKY
jgi:calcineurin-like phosphoesterase family protein